MRVLLDECVPTRLRHDLPGLDVATVAMQGWLGRRNGDLLRAMAEAGFTHLVTVDRNLMFQQNVAAAGVAVVVVHAPTNRIAQIRPLMAEVAGVLATSTGRLSRIPAGASPASTTASRSSSRQNSVRSRANRRASSRPSATMEIRCDQLGRVSAIASRSAVAWDVGCDSPLTNATSMSLVAAS